MMEATRITDILDTVLRTLYEHMDKNGLLFEKELLEANKIRLNPQESGKIWDVLRATGLVESIIGFGNEGKLELTPAGIQMMMRFGSYKNFLATQNISNSPQVTISVTDPGGAQPAKAAIPKQKPGKPKKAASSDRPHR